MRRRPSQRHAVRAAWLLLASALLFPFVAAASVDVYATTDPGLAPPAGTLPLPLAADYPVELVIDGGSAASAQGEACEPQSGDGNELCGWNLHVVTTGDVHIVDFAAEGDVAWHRAFTSLRANGGDPLAGDLGPRRVGTLSLAINGPGELRLEGGEAVDAGLALAPLPASTLATFTGGTACSDGVDNDGDGLTDFPADPGCAGADAVRESPECDDDDDNDGDGFIDWDGGGAGAADPECVGRPYRNNERSGCGLGAELAVLLPALAALRRRRVRR